MALRNLVRHISTYSIGNILVTFSGFISFPIFTRMFSVAEYGVLNLVTATLFLLLAVSKLGIQHSIVRFYGEVRSGRRSVTISQYLSTTLLGMTVVGLATTALWASASQLIPASWWSDPRVSTLFLITAVLLLIRTIDSALVNFLRAEERSGVLTTYNVAKRYGTLSLVLITLFFLARDLYGYFIATVIAEAIAVALLFISMRRTRQFAPSAYSPELFRRMLVFGIPMIAFELSGIVLDIGDRYVIEAMLGSESLGLYSAGHNFCQYIEVVFLSAFSQAIVPTYTRYWEEKGPEETGRLLQTAMHYYLMLAIPLVVGVSVVGEDMLVILASRKYADAAAIVPYVAAAMALGTSLSLFSAGLYIHKRTTVLAALMFACAVFNIVMNYLLIPHFGITGSAMATLLASAGLALGAWRASHSLLPMPFPWASAAKFSGLAALMYSAIAPLSFDSRWATLSAQILGGMSVYAALVVLLDRQARQLLSQLTAGLMRRS